MARPIILDKLHPKQLEIAQLIQLHKRMVLRCGRRFGKTTLLEKMALKWALDGEKVGWFGPSYKLNSPTYKRILRKGAHQVAHRSKIDQLIEMRSGGSVEFWTLNDEDAGRSRFYDKVIIDEGSLVETGLRDIWEQAIAPTLLDRRGSAIMAGTPKGIDPDNFFYEACTDKSLGWFECHLPTSANPMLDPEAVAKLKDEYPPLVYQQEYLAEFVDWNGSAFFAEDKLLVDGKPLELDQRIDFVFSTIDTATKDGQEHDGTAVVYWGRSKYAGYPLVVLDWDVTQIEASLLTDWLPSVLLRLDVLANEHRAREGSYGAWIEDQSSGIALIQSGQRLGLQIHAIEGKITAQGKEGRAIVASPYVYQEKVKLTKQAFDKTISYRQQTRNHLISQVCGFRMGQKRAEHKKDLLDAFVYGVIIGLAGSDGF